MDYGSELYDELRPVVTDWHVTHAEVKGEDVVLIGSMIKRRDCIFQPPTQAPGGPMPQPPQGPAPIPRIVTQPPAPGPTPQETRR